MRPRRIEREALDHIPDKSVRQVRLGSDDAQRIEGGIAHPLPRERRVGQQPDARQAGPGIRRSRLAAMILPVGKVVAGAAPGIEQPGPLARLALEQPTGGGEAPRAPRNRFLRGRDDRGTRRKRGSHRSPRRIWTIVSTGLAPTILSSSPSSVLSTISMFWCCGRTKPTLPICCQNSTSLS